MWQIHKFKFSRDVTFCTASHFAPCTSSGVRLLPFVQSQYRYRFTSSTSTWVIVNLLCLCNAVFSAALRLSELFWHCTCWQNTLLYEGDGDKFSIFFPVSLLLVDIILWQEYVRWLSQQEWISSVQIF